MKKFLTAIIACLTAAVGLFTFTACGNDANYIGVQSGTTGQYFVDGDAEWEFDGIDGYESKGYNNAGLAVTDLKNGNVKYVMVDKQPALALEKSVKGIKVIDIELTQEEYAFGVNKDDAKLLADINAILASAEFKTKLASIANAYASNEGINPVESAVYDASKNQLVVATNAEFAPFEYKEGNKFAGIDMEVAKYLADKLGMELVIKDMDFDSVVTSVGKNGIDIAMAGLTVNETRKQSVNFTTSYYNAAQVLITLEKDKDFDDCKTAEDVLAVLAKNK